MICPMCKACGSPVDKCPVLLVTTHTKSSCNLKSDASINTKFQPIETHDHWQDKWEWFHAACLQCALCGYKLNEEGGKCWKYNNCSFICLQCRIRLTHCARCHTRVPRDAWVHKFDQSLFHTTCMSCDQCGCSLQQGDKCGLWNDRLFCLDHFLSRNSLHQGQRVEWQNGMSNETMDKREERSNRVFRNVSRDDCEDTAQPNTNEITIKYHGVENSGQHSSITVDVAEKIEAASLRDKRQSIDSTHELDTTTSSANTTTAADQSLDSSASSGCSVHSKSKRIRTSFTPDQLAILQANFDMEANPDGQELERIANVARLNKRVTQVWFQNARARKKKIECKPNSPLNSVNVCYDLSYGRYQEHSKKLDADDCDSPTSYLQNESSTFAFHTGNFLFDSPLQSISMNLMSGLNSRPTFAPSLSLSVDAQASKLNALSRMGQTELHLAHALNVYRNNPACHYRSGALSVSDDTSWRTFSKHSDECTRCSAEQNSTKAELIEATNSLYIMADSA